jgi:prophage tail gpP-like protein
MPSLDEAELRRRRQLLSGVVLEGNGLRVKGWESIRVTRSIESISGSFDLGVVNTGTGRHWPIAEGDACRVLLDGVVVIDGYIDKRDVSASKDSRSLSYSGRDRASDLVDCSAIVDAGTVSKGKWSFHDVDVFQVAKAIAKPFGIPVSVQAGLGQLLTKNKKVVFQPGDTCFEVISKMAAAAGVLVVSDGAGGIMITRAGSKRAAALIEGVNILTASVTYDASDRFNRILISSQIPGTDEDSGEATHIEAQAIDEDIRDERVLIIRPDKGYSVAESRVRADWEARVRAARAEKVTITVQGWKQPDGTLWPVNAITRVQAPTLIGVDGDMVISSATFGIGGDGTITTLSLVRPDAFTPEPTATVKSSSGGRWKELDKGAK